MNLVPSAYAKIEAETKTIELRLNDEKRQAIAIDDLIVFTNTEDGRQMSVKVLALHHFPSFAELYRALPLTKCGYAEGEAAHPNDMLAYYPREKELHYGALGIEIKLVK